VMALLELAFQGVCLVTGQLRLSQVSPGLAVLLNMESACLEGLHISECLAPGEASDQLVKALETVPDEKNVGAARSMQVSLRNNGGRSVLTQLCYVPLAPQAGAQYLVAVLPIDPEEASEATETTDSLGPLPTLAKGRRACPLNARHLRLDSNTAAREGSPPPFNTSCEGTKEPPLPSPSPSLARQLLLPLHQQQPQQPNNAATSTAATSPTTTATSATSPPNTPTSTPNAATASLVAAALVSSISSRDSHSTDTESWKSSVSTNQDSAEEQSMEPDFFQIDVRMDEALSAVHIGSRFKCAFGVPINSKVACSLGDYLGDISHFKTWLQAQSESASQGTLQSPVAHYGEVVVKSQNGEDYTMWASVFLPQRIAGISTPKDGFQRASVRVDALDSKWACKAKRRLAREARRCGHAGALGTPRVQSVSQSLLEATPTPTRSLTCL